MPTFSEYYKATLTPSATDMLLSLRNLLFFLKENLAVSLFESILKRLSSKLDKLFYEDLILQTNFNEGGISQLDFDLNKFLFPILNELASELKIELVFRRYN
jgi:hypothetical protein